MTKVELNSNGTNKAIKANILSDDKMRKIGFTETNNGKWRYYREVAEDISFNVAIPKDGSDISIDTLDEAFLQPYDYQHILSVMPLFPFASSVKKNVEKQMQYLTDKGVIEGWKPGMYI